MAYAPATIANYFFDKASAEGRALTPMQLIKLVYIAHGWHLGYFGQPLINEEVEAWKFGPVIGSLYRQLKHYGSGAVTQRIRTVSPPWTVQFDPNVQRLLDHVWNAYKGYSGLQLSTLTHQQGTPWYVAWHERGGHTYMGAPVSNEDIARHYRERIALTQ